MHTHVARASGDLGWHIAAMAWWMSGHLAQTLDISWAIIGSIAFFRLFPNVKCKQIR